MNFGIEGPSAGSREMGEKIVEIIIEMFEVAEWFENRPYQSLPPVALQRNQLVARDTGKGESGRRIETCFEPFSNLSAGSFDAMCGGDGAVGFANAAGRFDGVPAASKNTALIVIMAKSRTCVRIATTLTCFIIEIDEPERRLGDRRHAKRLLSRRRFGGRRWRPDYSRAQPLHRRFRQIPLLDLCYARLAS